MNAIRDFASNLSCFEGRITGNLDLKGKEYRMKLREFVTTSNLGDIALIKSLLDAEGIPFLAHGEHFHSVRPLIEPVRFLVPEDDLDRAKPLIESIHLLFCPLSIRIN